MFPFKIVAFSCLLISLGACVPVAMTAAGVGGGAYTSHYMGGTASRTFSEPMPTIREAAATALRKMAIRLDYVEKTASGELIVAKAIDRNIEIELEAITAKATRMKVTARKDGGITLDGATAIEIIAQTEKLLPVR